MLHFCTVLALLLPHADAGAVTALVPSGTPICRTQELFQVLESLMLPRVSPTDPSQPLTPETQRRTAYMPKVTPGQRAILEFLQLELRSGWQMALTLLAKFSVAPGWREGGGGEEEVTVECTKEAASALSAMMSERVPRRDRALALEGLIAEVCVWCIV